MNTKRIMALCLACGASAFSMLHAETSQAELAAQANIKRNEAERIALQRVPAGSVQSAEIEHEKGHLVWSFDISKPGTNNVTEVLVDAKTGKILSVSKETPAQQSAEEKADKLKP
jgi:uncharacterized membrane protein YkoI